MLGHLLLIKEKVILKGLFIVLDRIFKVIIIEILINLDKIRVEELHRK